MPKNTILAKESKTTSVPNRSFSLSFKETKKSKKLDNYNLKSHEFRKIYATKS